MKHPELKYTVSLVDVVNQRFVLMQGNGCSLTVQSDADGDSLYYEGDLRLMAERMAKHLNDQ